MAMWESAPFSYDDNLGNAYDINLEINNHIAREGAASPVFAPASVRSTDYGADPFRRVNFDQ